MFVEQKNFCNIMVFYEVVYEVVVFLENKEVYYVEGVDVYFGWYFEYGNIFIVILVFGDGMFFLFFVFYEICEQK